LQAREQFDITAGHATAITLPDAIRLVALFKLRPLRFELIASFVFFLQACQKCGLGSPYTFACAATRCHIKFGTSSATAIPNADSSSQRIIE
jgi:hypothetical protein